MKWKDQDLAQLAEARQLLENPSLAIKLTNLIGAPIEGMFKSLPDKAIDVINSATRTALEKATLAVSSSLGNDLKVEPRNLLHKISAAASGAGGGFFGLPGLAVDLPLSTLIMLRSIADTARTHGEDLTDPKSRLACIEVFALGGKAAEDDAIESAYFAIRAALAKSVSDAAAYLAQRGATKLSEPVLVKLIATVAGRFSIQVSQKAAAMAVPIIGAAGGAVINTVFIDHFQDMAQGHFTIRRLERLYGAESVRKRYDELSAASS